MGRQAIAIVRVSRAGSSKHIQYICRPEAVQPATPLQPERVYARATSTIELDGRERNGNLKSKAAHAKEEKAASFKQLSEDQGIEQATHKADAVWTWNAPAYVTGDNYGTLKQAEAIRKSGRERTPRIAPDSGKRSLGARQLSLAEKIENARAYFGLLSDAEKRKGGVNSYRAVLTVKGEASDHEMREAVNNFLHGNFPLAQALVALHRNTEHVHAHLYVHSRQLNGRKISLGQDYFQLDESWAKVCSEHFKDKAIYNDHMQLKSATKEWKRQRAQAQARGQSVSAKSGRWSDLYEVKHAAVRPWDDHWVGRLKAAARVAKTKADYLRASKAPEQKIIEASREAHELQQKLELVAEKRLHARSEMKREMPSEVITIEEQKELARYTRAVHDATATQQNSFNKQPALSQLAFDFTKSSAGQMAFDFYIPRAEKISNKQTHNKAKKPKAKNKTTNLRSEKDVVKELVSPTETCFDLQTRQMKIREQGFQSAHTAAINGLLQIAQKEGVVSNPQEFARLQSENLRQEIQEKHNISIHDLGYTRENWATIILSRVSDAIRRETVNHPNFTVSDAEREISAMRRAVEVGDEKMLTVLAGKDLNSRSSDILDHEHSVSCMGQDRLSAQQREDSCRSIDPENQSQSTKEQIFERTDRDEHFFSR